MVPTFIACIFTNFRVPPLITVMPRNAPSEIIQFLLKSYQSLYPDHDFNWTMMVETMGRTDTPKESIENLLHVKQMHFPNQPIDWVYLLNEYSNTSAHASSFTFKERMQFLVMCGMSDRVDALPFKVWRHYIKNVVHSAEFKYNEQFGNKHIISTIQAKVPIVKMNTHSSRKLQHHWSLHYGS
jgi:hypothetical protein